MPLRERVRQAIDAPVSEAGALLDEARDASESERLLIFVNGWFRGISATLEELAIEVDLDTRQPPPRQPFETGPRRPGSAGVKAEKPDSQEETRPPAGEVVEADEAALAERARMSREKTAAMRQESGEAEAPEA